MKSVGSLLGFALATAVTAVALPAGSFAFSIPPGSAHTAARGTPIVLVNHAAVKKKKIRSCNKGDDRKAHARATVDAWAVACEFPPRSEPNFAAAHNAAVAALLAGGL